MIEDGRLERAKVEKHRECWPTAFYERTHNGEPIFVDRMGILGAFLSTLEYTLTHSARRLTCMSLPFTVLFFLAWQHTTDLNRLKKSLTMKDMVTYYVQTMEARRRILFPHLSRRTGQLVTQVRLLAYCPVRFAFLAFALFVLPLLGFASAGPAGRSALINMHALMPLHAHHTMTNSTFR